MSQYSSKGKNWKEIRLQVLARDNYTCGYCNSEANSVDHIQPRAKGGSDDLSNLIAACSVCQRTKSDKTLFRTQWFNPKYPIQKK